MDRQWFTFSTQLARTNCLRALHDAPDGTRVQINGPKRTHEQNKKMWAMLADVAAQYEHFGRFYPKERWKLIFLHALGKETEFVPSLDGADVVPVGQSSSDLSITEMADLIEFLYAWGAEKGIEWSEPPNPADLRAADVGRAA